MMTSITMTTVVAWWERLLPQSSRLRLRITALDLCLNLFLFTPLVVLHYYATCLFLDSILCRYYPRLGAWIIFLIGLSIEFLAGVGQRKLADVIPRADPADGQPLPHYAVASRMFNYVLVFGNVCHMKAVADLYEHYVGGEFNLAFKAATTGIVALWGLRCGRNILAAPFCLGLDTEDTNFFECSTLFATEPDGSPENMADTAATVGVVYTFIHLHWAGIWAMLDAAIFPERHWLSMFSCILIGYSITIAFLLLQHKAREISRTLERDHEMKKLAFENIYILVAGFAVISSWRGIWMFFDTFANYFPIYYRGFDITPLATNILSFALLTLANLTNCLPYKGCEIDGEMKDGEGVMCCTGYFTEFLREFIEEEEQKEEKDMTPSQSTEEVQAAVPKVVTPTRAVRCLTKTGYQKMASSMRGSGATNGASRKRSQTSTKKKKVPTATLR